MLKHSLKLLSRIGLVAAVLTVAGCQGGIDGIFPKAEKPLPPKLARKIKDKGMTTTSPILIRIFKSENKLEVWKAKASGQYAFLTDYEICKWSGKLGPKLKEGDKQAPEGFYQVTPAQMNPNSQYHLSFNMGFPNSFDRSHGRTGSHLMIHGACSSAGCYSMTDEYVEEIYALARDAFKGGQKSFQIQAFPFRMTPANLAKHVTNPNYEFWKLLKEGSDHFDITKRPPKVDVCDRRYVFNQIADEGKPFVANRACPASATPTSLALAYTKKAYEDQDVFVKILSKQANSPFLDKSLRSAAKRLTPLEKEEMQKLKLRQAALVQKQQAETLDRQRAAAQEAEKQRQEEPEPAPDVTAATEDPSTSSNAEITQDAKSEEANKPEIKRAAKTPGKETKPINTEDNAANARVLSAHDAAGSGVLVIQAPEIQIAKPKKKLP